MVEDLSEDLVVGLVGIEKREAQKAELLKLHSELADRYAKKDQQMNKLMARAKK